MIISKKEALFSSLIYLCALIIQLSISFYYSHQASVDLLKNIPDLRFLNTPIGVHDYLKEIGEAGRKYYIYSAIYDSFYALVYTSVGIIIWRFFTQNQFKGYYSAAPLFLIFAMVADLIENLFYMVL